MPIPDNMITRQNIHRVTLGFRFFLFQDGKNYAAMIIFPNFLIHHRWPENKKRMLDIWR